MTRLLHGMGDGHVPFFDFEGLPVMVRPSLSRSPARERRPARANARAVPGLGHVVRDADGRGIEWIAPPFSPGTYSEAEVTLTS